MHEIVIWKFVLVSYNKKYILELKPNGTDYTHVAKACGCDGISYKVIKLCCVDFCSVRKGCL